MDRRLSGIEGSPKVEEEEEEEERRLAGDEQAEDEWAPKWDELPIHILRPLESGRISLDFRDIPAGFRYNEHYAIVILGRADGYVGTGEQRE